MNPLVRLQVSPFVCDSHELNRPSISLQSAATRPTGTMLLHTLVIAVVYAAQSPGTLAAQYPGSLVAQGPSSIATESPDSLAPSQGQYTEADRHYTTERVDSTGVDNATTSTLPVIHKATLLEEYEGVAYDKMCDTSCKQKCGRRGEQGDSQCYCDRACLQLGDCCLDYEASCLSGPQVTRDNYADILRNRTSRVAKCVESLPVTHRDGTVKSVSFPAPTLVVSSCGDLKTTNTSTIDLCERPTQMNRTLDTDIPVLFRDVIYRNKYCAVCNNPGGHFTDLSAAGVMFNCVNTTIDASDHWQRYGRNITYDEAISKCTMQFNLSDFESVFRYRCRMEDTTPSVCKADSQFDHEYLLSMCHKYRAHIYHDTSSYSNPHCAMCSDPIPPYSMECTPFADVSECVGDECYDFSKMIEFQVTYYCPNGKVYDHVTASCVTLSCPAGHVKLRDNSCAKLNVTVPQMFSAERDIRIYVVISTESHELGRYDQGLSIHDINVDVISNSIKHSICSAFKVGILNNWDEVISKTSTCWFQEAVSRNFRDVFNQIAFSVDAIFPTVKHSIFVFNRNANETPVACLNGSQKMRRDVYFLDDGSDTTPSKFVVLNTSQVYDASDVPLVVSWSVNVSDSTRWMTSFAAFVCEPDILSCETVTFQKNDYLDNGGSLVLFKGTPEEVEIPEKTVLRLESKAIVLCASQLGNVTVIRAADRDGNTTDALVKDMLSLIGNILSMICLAFTMAIYCVFKEIRTQAGLCVMNLCGALFFAQMCFIVNNNKMFLTHREVCVTAAAFQHYIWLVTFLWMNVLAFDVSCTFAHMKPSGSARKTSRMCAFAVYAWGLPAVFVVICLVIDFCTDLPFTYGSKTTCWLAGPGAIVYYFAIPLAAVLAANLVLFVHTAVALRRATTIANRARQPRQQRTNVFVYIRLTSLMGFTWLFGFLANIDVLSFLWYPFIVCNSCQGIVIFVSFALTATVRRLWWVRCGGKKSSSGSVSDTRLKDLEWKEESRDVRL